MTGNLWNFNKCKSQVLYLKRNNSHAPVEARTGKQFCSEGPAGSGRQQVEHELEFCC